MNSVLRADIYKEKRETTPGNVCTVTDYEQDNSGFIIGRDVKILDVIAARQISCTRGRQPFRCRTPRWQKKLMMSRTISDTVRVDQKSLTNYEIRLKIINCQENFEANFI
jgi:hypothetical protein